MLEATIMSVFRGGTAWSYRSDGGRCLGEHVRLVLLPWMLLKILLVASTALLVFEGLPLGGL